MYSIERLLRVSRGEESANSTLDHPLEHLLACHGRIEERLQVLERAGGHFEADPSAALEAIRSAFRYFDTSGVKHTADEEESVFPRLAGKLAPEEAAGIARLEAEHREADDLYAELKSTADELERDPASKEALSRYRELAGRFGSLYRTHIEYENSELIRVARRELAGDDLAEISNEMRRRRQ